MSITSLMTPHGEIKTPVFMPVGTQATVKSISADELHHIGAQIILANNYHLYLRPGGETIHELGGLHSFMNWPKPILTDSGGFQVLSLGGKNGMVKITPDGIKFKSHIDGSTHFWTPEDAIRHQFLLGADIIMPLDIATPHTATKSEAKQAMKTTHEWLVRCKNEWLRLQNEDPRFTNHHPLLFGIVQGGYHRELRRESAQFITDLDLPGISIGGETIGYYMNETEEVLSWIDDILPKNKPHYAMGLGGRPSDLTRAFACGIDMCDCVAPTRIARHGMVYVSKDVSANEMLNLNNAKFRHDKTEFNPQLFPGITFAYLHHLFKAGEILGIRIATLHNLSKMIETANQC